MSKAISARADALILELLREFGVTIDCGQLMLNFNQGKVYSYDATVHQRLDRKTG